MSAVASAARPRAVARWLVFVAGLVLLMVIVGGITRLTESGLSMVRWEPVSGIVPPLDDAAWQAEFDAYKAFPEYQKVNRGMSLAEFKAIYFWEYVHRVLGRLIGLAFALPLVWFWVRGAIPAAYKPRLVALLALGGLQGTIGWWMVASGLVDRPDVAHERLAVHLGVALFILAGLVWTALDLFAHGNGEHRSRLRPLAAFALFMLAVQIGLGAFVAGLDAGHAFAEWPLMGGRFFPDGTVLIDPVWRNAVDNPVVVQWLHRWWAWLAALMLVVLAVRTARESGGREPNYLLLLLAFQIVLGVATLLTGVELVVAVAHQAVAALLVVSTVVTSHRFGRPGRSLR
jgi:cytochrome c oxidase assembly protein subunit 15